ncbi:MAG: glycoside hydrolase family 13 protein [Bacteroidales bacterium]
MIKKQIHFLISLAVAAAMISCNPTETQTTAPSPPDWAQDAIWYQIFVERFYNGDTTNDPTPEDIHAASNFLPVPAGWSVTPWTHNWYEQESWAKEMNVPFYDGLQLRRFGGDIQGIIDKLDYLQDLGVTALYLNPINDAPSLHKFDARNWRHVDVNFGPDPEGDKRIMESEDPDDPSTWKWTSADKLFLELVHKLHQRDMRIILDYSWNHTGVEFWAWKDVVKNQQNSEFADWYEIKSFDDPDTPENEFKYQGWANLSSLPEIKKVKVDGERHHGHPYEGDIYPEVKEHIYAVTKRWLAPEGDVSKGIDGFRLDVADQIGMIFWRTWNNYVKSINPDAYLVGEIWWVDWPEVLMDPTPYVQGDVFDAVMFYQIYRPARYFFAETDFEIDAKQFFDSLQFQWNRLPEATRYAMMNTAATHDAPRLLTSFYNPGKYKYNAKPDADSTYRTGKPSPETYRRVKLYLMHQFTIMGGPQIWAGDEMGMWGADDPDTRKPLWWPEYVFEPEFRNSILPEEKIYDEVGFNREWFGFYRKLISIRKENPVLARGDIEFMTAEGKLLSYKRFDGTNEIIVMFNLQAGPHSFDLPQGAVYRDLMSGEEFSGQAGVDNLSGRILKRITS